LILVKTPSSNPSIKEMKSKINLSHNENSRTKWLQENKILKKPFI